MSNLNEIKKGQKVKIEGFSGDSVMCNMARLGILKGDVITCIAKVGPIIIGKEQLKLAVGKHLAKHIFVNRITENN